MLIPVPITADERQLGLRFHVRAENVPDPVPAPRCIVCKSLLDPQAVQRHGHKAVTCSFCGRVQWFRVHHPNSKKGGYLGFLAILLCVMITPANLRAQNLGSNSSPVVNRQGIPLGGVNIAICQPAATTAASVTNNIAVLTMASNPITAGFAPNMPIIVSGFTGADTYLNAGTLTNGKIVGGWTILTVTPTTVVFSINHANASTSTNGIVLQEGNGTTPCAGLAVVYQDPALTVPSVNPITSDQLGNWNVFATFGIYYVQFYSPSITPTVKIIGVSPSTAGGLAGTVTSVNLSTPHEIITAGSPCTTVCTLVESWSAEVPNTVFAGPTVNSVGTTFDGQVSNASGSTSLTFPLTVTPTGIHDLALFFAQTDGSIAESAPPVVAGTGTWTLISNYSGANALYSQLLGSNSPLTATASVLTTPTNWAGAIVLLASTGTPIFVQSVNASGSINSPTTTTSFGALTTAGNSILAFLIGVPNSTVNGRISDSEGNLYTPIAIALNPSGGREVVSVWLSTNIKGGTHDNLTFTTITGAGISGSLIGFEMSGLTLPTAIPTFRPLSTADMPTSVALIGSALVSGNCVQALTVGGVVQIVTSSGPCGTSSGTTTVTGSPVTGELTEFSGATSITNGNLSGDCTTTNTLVITCTQSNGHPIPIIKTGSAGGCTTSGSSYAGCSTTISWSGGAFADTSYFAVCMGVSPTNFPYIEGISGQSASSITVTTRNGTSNGSISSTYATINCIGVHP